MGRYRTLYTTAEIADLLGVTTVTVTRYARYGLLHPLFKSRPLIFDGKDVATFKRDLWPLLRPGRPRRGKSALGRPR